MLPPEEAVWRCLWIKAFPVLSPVLLFQEDGNEHCSSDDFTTDTIWEKYLAWNTVWHGSGGGSGGHANMIKSLVNNDRVRKGAATATISNTTTNNNENDNAPNHHHHPHIWQAESFGYGEMTPKSVLQVMERISISSQLLLWRARNHRRRMSWEEVTVIDLGSGRGIALLVILTTYPVAKVLGLEWEESLHQQAVTNYQQIWKPHNGNHFNLRGCCGNVEFRHCDFTVDTDWVTTTTTTRSSTTTEETPTRSTSSSSSIILCHATVFEPALLRRLYSLCGSCASGTIFVMVSQPLKHVSIATVETMELEMSWGRSTVFLQVKL